MVYSLLHLTYTFVVNALTNSDIVSFTEISSTLDPRKVANMLDRLYHKLDDLSEKHDLYKVETIGKAVLYWRSC